MKLTLILCLLIGIYIFKGLNNIRKGISYEYLSISFLLSSVPFQIFKYFGDENLNLQSGTLGSRIMISVPSIIVFIFLFFFANTSLKIKNLISLDRWSLFLLFFCLVSLLNPINEFKWNTLVATVFIFQWLFTLNIIFYTLSYKDLIKGIYDGLRLLTVAQLILAVCFPVLQITAVTSLFHEVANEWSTRLGSREGAVGFFSSPGNLAIFSIFSGVYFISCYLNGYKKNDSILLVFLSSITLFLTYSRTAYLTYILIVPILYFVNTYKKTSIFSPLVLLRVLLPTMAFLGWIIFYSPISDLFLKSDTTQQYDNRMVHWFMATKIFFDSPIIGVGLNGHLSYLSKNFFIASNLTLDDFFLSNPIHNIHLIILSEIGGIGLLIWLFFLVTKIESCRKNIALLNGEIISLGCIGVIVSVMIYGLTGWAPFSTEILPFFLFFLFYSNKVI